MYPDLSYFFHDLLGTQVDNWTAIFKSFGLLLGLAFIACAWLLNKELKRYEAEGKIKATLIPNPNKKRMGISEMMSNGFVTAVIVSKLPYIIQNFEAFKSDPAAIIFSKLGNWLIGIPVALAYVGFIYYNDQKRDISQEPEFVNMHPHQRTWDIIMIAAISGVLGSKLLSILENLDSFFRDPLGQLFSGSGLTVYGGLILAFVAVYWFVKKAGIKPIYMMDIAGMGILLGYAIGRMGCQIAGDGDWGITAAAQPTWWFLPDWLWSYHYPNNVNNDGVTVDGCSADAITSAKGYIEERCKMICGIRYCHKLDPMVYPTPIYETILCGLGFLLLFLWRKKVKIAGSLFFAYMIFNGLERLFIEFIRVNERYPLFGMNLSMAQYISIAFVLIGICGLIYLHTARARPQSDSM